MRDLVPHVSATLSTRGLIPADGRILVAVSGGMDSMVLLHALHELATPAGLRLTVAHAHHQLRPRAADADAAWVRKKSEALGLECRVERLPVREIALQTGDSVEMAARRLRHEFLARTAVELGISTIALAHHADDQAELVLLRMFRGAGGDGIGGMSWLDPSPAIPGVRLIRPLLDQTREQLRAAALSGNLSFREDKSNQDLRILRNRVRARLLPLLEKEYSPGIRDALVRTAEIVGGEAEFVAKEARKWLLAPRRTAFQRLHPAVQRAVLREQLRRLGREPGFDLVERLRTSEGVQEIGPGVRVQRQSSGRIVKVSPKPELGHRPDESRLALQSGGGDILWSETRFQYSFARAGRSRIPSAHPRMEQFDAEAVGNEVTLRHWRAGDRFQPLGFPRPAKLQDILTNRKIPAERRRRLIVATTANGSIFWVESLPPGHLFRVTSGTRRLLVWKWRAGA